MGQLKEFSKMTVFNHYKNYGEIFLPPAVSLLRPFVVFPFWEYLKGSQVCRGLGRTQCPSTRCILPAPFSLTQCSRFSKTNHVLLLSCAESFIHPKVLRKSEPTFYPKTLPSLSTLRTMTDTRAIWEYSLVVVVLQGKWWRGRYIRTAAGA